MHSSLDCIPCFIRQALEAARFITDDPAVHEQAIRAVLRMAAEMDLSQSPPWMGQMIHRHLRQITAAEDPYRAAKDRFNQLALLMLPDLRKKVEAEPDRLLLAARLAIASNVIDFAVNGSLLEEKVRKGMEQTIQKPIRGNIDAFRQAIAEAEKILYLADNAGEIVFDRLLIEQLPRERVTLAVRGAPVINDATQRDAKTAGLHDLVEVIDNGSDAPGTILTDCSPAFQRQFNQADLIIAKGQGNYETLSDVPANIFFLFKVKCPVIARQIGAEIGSLILRQNRILETVRTEEDGA